MPRNAIERKIVTLLRKGPLSKRELLDQFSLRGSVARQTVVLAVALRALGREGMIRKDHRGKTLVFALVK